MASKKRGLSLEEKRQRMLELFYSKKEFFLLKELEKIAPKEKGIVSQSVKDVLQSLVDDNLVDTDKIGTSVYFWSFPSKATQNRKRAISDIEEKTEEARKRIKQAKEDMVKEKEGREETEERQTALAELSDLKAKKLALEAEIQKYKDNDPEVLDKMKAEIATAIESANRWTDNIFAIHSWIGRKFPSVSVADLNKQFGIPDDLDYLET